jgi:hypothetical protein
MIVILGPDAEVKPITEAPYKRDTDDDLAKLAEYQIPPSTRPSASPIHEAPAIRQRIESILR